MPNGTLQNFTPIREMKGQPGQAIGNVVFPSRGEVIMRIQNDVLETSIVTAYGLEKREVHTRIQRIESVEVVEGRFWWLLGIGIPMLLFYGLGIIPIVLFFVIKQRWLMVYNASGNLLLFHNDQKKAQDFCRTVMAISRQLNTKAASAPTKNLPVQSGGQQRL